jgi:hypothetical protein
MNQPQPTAIVGWPTPSSRQQPWKRRAWQAPRRSHPCRSQVAAAMAYLSCWGRPPLVPTGPASPCSTGSRPRWRLWLTRTGCGHLAAGAAARPRPETKRHMPNPTIVSGTLDMDTDRLQQAPALYILTACSSKLEPARLVSATSVTLILPGWPDSSAC